MARVLAEPEALAAHVETHGPALLAALDALRQEAGTKPHGGTWCGSHSLSEVADWVTQARSADARQGAEKHLEEAKKWVAAEIEAERKVGSRRSRRRAIDFWNTIARESNVQLQDIELTGHGNAKRVALKVTVDDKDAPALGVLSQGELNAMTLSLFLPRVLMPATPFGFVIVDDPGAGDGRSAGRRARAGAHRGRQDMRQVVVFTHDARLPEAFERLACRTPSAR